MIFPLLSEVVPGFGAGPDRRRRRPLAGCLVVRWTLSGRRDIRLSGSSRILDAVAGMGVVPAWVVPPAVEVEDLFWAARALRKDPASGRITARGAAVAWVCGGVAAPVTGRTETPVTWGLASAEMWAALVVCARSAPPPHEDVCAGWGVHYLPPVAGVGLGLGYGVLVRWGGCWAHRVSPSVRCCCHGVARTAGS